MQTVSLVLMLFLIICALCAAFSRNLFNTVLIFMGFGIILSIIWLILQAPDLSITEAAVGVGVDSVLFFLTLRKLKELKTKEGEDEPQKP